MNKKTQMNFNLNNFLLSVTDILDNRDIEKNNVSKSHSLRIAYVSLKIGEQLSLEPKEMFNLCAYSLFHNYIDSKNSKILRIEDTTGNIKKIVTFVHHLDEEYDLSKSEIKNRSKIISSVNNEEELELEFLKISSSIDFWMDCQSPSMIIQYIYGTLYDFTEVLTFEEVLNRTKMFGNIYEDVNPFLEKCKKMIEFYSFEEKDKWTFLISASMLQFGKLSLPSEIIWKKSKLTDSEYEIVKSNIYYNKNALRTIYGFEDISKWASRHQEQLDGKGYPSQLNASDLSLKDRLMSVLNIYTALVSEKLYRSKYSHNEAIEILSLMAKDYRLDTSIIKDLQTVFN